MIQVQKRITKTSTKHSYILNHPDQTILGGDIYG